MWPRAWLGLQERGCGGDGTAAAWRPLESHILESLLQVTCPPPPHPSAATWQKRDPPRPCVGPGHRPEDIPKNLKPWERDDLSPKWEVQLVSPPSVETGLGLDFESRKRPQLSGSVRAFPRPSRRQPLSAGVCIVIWD